LEGLGKKVEGFDSPDRTSSQYGRLRSPSEPPYRPTLARPIPDDPGREPRLHVASDRIVTRVRTAEEKGVDASTDLAASKVVDGLWPKVMVGPAQASIAVQVPTAIGQVADGLQSAVTSSVSSVATGMGLAPGAAAVSAGICSNLLLAPITGTLDQIATFVEVAGLIVGLATGAHPLALACGKLLLHSQAEKLLARELGSPFGGPHGDLPETSWAPSAGENLRWLLELRNSLPQVAPSPEPAHKVWAHNEQRTVPQVAADAPGTRQDASPQPLWLCLGFTRERSLGAALHIADIGSEAGSPSDIRKTVILPPGDDEFFRTLPAVLDRSTVLRVGMRTAKHLSAVPEGWHFVVSTGSTAVGGIGGVRSPQSGYIHPGCRTGRCAPRGRFDCRCSCAICRQLRLRVRGKTSA
jgi:hypothetical protein